MSDLETLVTDASGDLLSSYVAGSAGLVESVGGATTTYLRDARGDIRTETDDLGAVITTHDIDAWGSGQDGFAFLGAQQRKTFDQGFVQMGARVYVPGLGAFMSEDPVIGQIGNSQTLNRHAYAWDNPVNTLDLNGLFPGEGVVNGVTDVVDNGWEATSGVRGWTATAAADGWDWTSGGANDAWTYASDRFADFIKDNIDFSDTEAAANAATTLITYAACQAAAGPALAAGPEAEGAAAVTCLALDAVGAGSLGVDLADHDNSVAFPGFPDSD